LLDVHPPHERVHGWRDFLLHILTITIGLFIALMLEGLVEWRHHVHLVEEARETLRHEIEHNQQQLLHDLASLHHERSEMDKNLATLRAVQEHPSAPQHNMSLAMDFSSGTLDDTAWKTAQASGALGYMPYTEAQRFADVYGSQADLRDAQTKVLDDIALFQGLVARFDLDGPKPFRADAAQALSERVGVLRTHIIFVQIAAEETLGQEKALLEGRPAPNGFSEKLN
jgi:hypothetical protein